MSSQRTMSNSLLLIVRQDTADGSIRGIHTNHDNLVELGKLGIRHIDVLVIPDMAKGSVGGASPVYFLPQPVVSGTPLAQPEIAQLRDIFNLGATVRSGDAVCLSIENMTTAERNNHITQVVVEATPVDDTLPDAVAPLSAPQAKPKHAIVEE